MVHNVKLDTIKLIIEYGYDIHYDNDILLYTFSCSHHTDIVQYLLECGANLHGRDDDQTRCLSHQMSELLLKYGAVKYTNKI